MLITKRKVILFLVLEIIFFVALYSFIGIQKHVHFQTFGWDTAVFDQQFYFVSQLKAPYSSLVKMNGLGDHFQLISLLLGGLFYRFFSHPFMLFILQSMVACLAALPLYLINMHLLKKTKLSRIAVNGISLTVGFVFLTSVPFQSMLTDEFHNEPFLITPLLFMIYYLIKKNKAGYWICFTLVILTKEIFGLLGIPLGIYVWLKNKDLKTALLTTVIGLTTTYMLLFQIMPLMAKTENYLHFGENNNPKYLVNKFVSKPSSLITEFYDDAEKRKTVTASLFSFGFLPLLAPVELIAPTFSLAMRFFDDTTPRLYAFNNHYAAPFIPLLAVALSFGIYRLIMFFEKKNWHNKGWKFIIIYLILMTIWQDYVYRGPINSLLKPQFYQTFSFEKDAHELINMVPAGAVIATQNSLLPHLSQRDDFYLLPEIGKAEYVVADLADGPNKFSPLDLAQTEELIDGLIESRQYQITWQKNKSLLLKKLLVETDIDQSNIWGPLNKKR